MEAFSFALLVPICTIGGALLFIGLLDWVLGPIKPSSWTNDYEDWD